MANIPLFIIEGINITTVLSFVYLFDYLINEIIFL